MPRTEEQLLLDDPLDQLVENAGSHDRSSSNLKNLNANLIALPCLVPTFRPLRSGGVGLCRAFQQLTLRGETSCTTILCSMRSLGPSKPEAKPICRWPNIWNRVEAIR